MAKSLLIATEVSLLHLQLIVLAKNGASLLCFELCNLDLALPVLVFARLFNAVVFLHYECQRLRHVFLVLHQLLQLTLLLGNLKDLLLSPFNFNLLLR